MTSQQDGVGDEDFVNHKILWEFVLSVSSPPSEGSSGFLFSLSNLGPRGPDYGNDLLFRGLNNMAVIIVTCGLNLSMKSKELKNLLASVCSKKVPKTGIIWLMAWNALGNCKNLGKTERGDSNARRSVESLMLMDDWLFEPLWPVRFKCTGWKSSSVR